MRLQVPEEFIDQINDGLRAASGEIHTVIAFHARPARSNWVSADSAQEFGIAPAPAVEALLEVTHEEGRPPFSRGIVRDFIKVIRQDFPLPGAGVLKLVEEPMLYATIESIIDVELGATLLGRE